MTETFKIRNLTRLELATIKRALETLQATSAVSTTDNWAAGVMLEDDAKFIKHLLWLEKGTING